MNRYIVRFYWDLHIHKMTVYADSRDEAKKIFFDYMGDIDGIGDIVQISKSEA